MPRKNMPRKNSLYLLSPFCVLLATEGLAAKNYSLQPTFSTSLRWDSNYYYDHADDKKAVYTWLFQPGLVFDYQAAKTQLEGAVTLNGYDYSGSDAPDDFISLTLKADLRRSSLSRRLTLGLRDTLTYTRDPEHRGELEQVTSRDLYRTNTFNPYLGYDLNRFSIAANYYNTSIKYDEDSNEDTALHRGTLAARYKMNRTYEFGPHARVQYMDYDQDTPHYFGWELGGNVLRNGKFVNISGGLGYHKRNIDDPEKSSLDTLTWNIGLTSQATGLKKTRFNIRLLGDINDAVTDEGYYSSQQVNASVERRISKDLSLAVNASYRWHDYKHTDREDDIWHVGASARYKANRWLHISLEGGYQHQEIRYNEQELDAISLDRKFDNTFCMVKLSYMY